MEFTFDVKSLSAGSTLGQSQSGYMWLDTEGDEVKKNYRSRLVVRQQSHKGEDGRALVATFFFSAMLPREGIKMLGSLMVKMLPSQRHKPFQIQF